MCGTPQNLSKEEVFEKSRTSKSFDPQPSHDEKSFFDKVKEMFQ